MPASDSPAAGCHSLIRYRQSGTPAVPACCARPGGNAVHGTATAPGADTVPATPVPTGRSGALPALPRSEEHTSELQSRENLVCRLLLEKKKKEKAIITHHRLRGHRLSAENRY